MNSRLERLTGLETITILFEKTVWLMSFCLLWFFININELLEMKCFPERGY